MAKYKVKPTVTFSRKEQADVVMAAIQEAFTVGKEEFKTKWISKSKWDTYVVSWDSYNDFDYVTVKILKKLEVPTGDDATGDFDASSGESIPF